MGSIHYAILALLAFCNTSCHAFVTTTSTAAAAAAAASRHASGSACSYYYGNTKLYNDRNTYDYWRSDAVVIDSMHLDEENVQMCLDEFIESEYGTTMFGCHARAAQIGITGLIELEEVCGPEVTLRLEGKFWHKRSTVLGRAAVWLNARIPEITEVVVANLEDLEDFEEIVDEVSGDVLFRKDKRSEDFNGDRYTMEYQGMDPDARGPFPQSATGSGGSMINPA
mmetsp:Transcript_23737/g.51898  ORF Transcript_23737/g.51898 Transcript_23737/m.51898 type:complete len:225 (-) Transcript_23737:423-1097(-)